MKKLICTLLFFIFILPVYILANDVIIVEDSSNNISQKIISSFVKNVNGNYRIIKKSENNSNYIIKTIKTNVPELVIALGDDSAGLIKDAVNGQNIRVIVALVNNERKLIDNENIFGVVNRVNCQQVFNNIKRFFPEIKAVGIFKSVDSNYFVDSLKSCNKKEGLFILDYSVTDMKDLNNQLLTTFPSFDLFYLQRDSLLLNKYFIKSLVIKSVLYNRPIITYSEKLLNLGAVLAITVDYSDVGNKMSLLANTILKKKTPVSRFIFPRSKVYFNKKIAKKLNINIPDSALKNVVIIGE